MANQGKLKNLRIISTPGKATGANKYYSNVAHNNSRPFCLNFQKVMSLWESVSEPDFEESTYGTEAL